MGKIQYHQLSQSVHARNFEALLSALGERAKNLPQLKQLLVNFYPAMMILSLSLTRKPTPKNFSQT